MADHYPLSNGDYLIDVSLTGGSGKASIKSPAKLHIDGGDMTAEIEWSSPNYDYMELDGEAYKPVNESGNSLFVVAIPALDAEIPIKAETTAMSEPHMIDYTLCFNSSTAVKQGFGVYSTTGEIIGVSALVVLGVMAAVLKKRIKNEKE